MHILLRSLTCVRRLCIAINLLELAERLCVAVFFFLHLAFVVFAVHNSQSMFDLLEGTNAAHINWAQS